MPRGGRRRLAAEPLCRQGPQACWRPTAAQGRQPSWHPYVHLDTEHQSYVDPKGANTFGAMQCNLGASHHDAMWLGLDLKIFFWEVNF
jgi:hypothetical protein